MSPPRLQEVPVHAPSYVSGPSTTPLLGEPIGECLRRAVRAFLEGL